MASPKFQQIKKTDEATFDRKDISSLIRRQMITEMKITQAEKNYFFASSSTRTLSLTQPLSLTHTLIHAHPRTHSHTHRHTHPPTHPPTHTHTHLLTHPDTHTFSHTHAHSHTSHSLTRILSLDHILWHVFYFLSICQGCNFAITSNSKIRAQSQSLAQSRPTIHPHTLTHTKWSHFVLAFEHNPAFLHSSTFSCFSTSRLYLFFVNLFPTHGDYLKSSDTWLYLRNWTLQNEDDGLEINRDLCVLLQHLDRTWYNCFRWPNHFRWHYPWDKK